MLNWKGSEKQKFGHCNGQLWYMMLIHLSLVSVGEAGETSLRA